MGITEILVYILSGYGIVSLFVIIKILIDYSKLRVAFEVNKTQCQHDLEQLEKRIEREYKCRDKQLSSHVESLTALHKTLFSTLEKIENKEFSTDPEPSKDSDDRQLLHD